MSEQKFKQKQIFFLLNRETRSVLCTNDGRTTFDTRQKAMEENMKNWNKYEIMDSFVPVREASGAKIDDFMKD